MSIKFDPPADLEVVELPHAQVATRDGVPVELDMDVYYCYSPEICRAYRVASNTAVRLPNGRWGIWVIDSNGFATTRDAIEHSTDVAVWLDFFRKRHSGELPPENGSAKPPRQRRGAATKVEK